MGVIPLLRKVRNKGVSFVEVLITAAVIGLVFSGLIGSLQIMLSMIRDSAATAGAIALANQRIEFIRSLSYDDAGTVSGIPNGTIPQNATSTLNGIDYFERVLIEYVDAPEDGAGAADVNGIHADYKRVKVEYSWNTDGATSSIMLITNIVPPGMETTLGGGTLTVNVFDATVQPVESAAVHLFNDTGTSTVDTTRYTNVDGVAMFAGTAANADYEITVTRAGWSTDQTYAATTSNPNPTTPHVAVLESQVSTMNFQIDELSDLTVRTVGAAVTSSFVDTFADSSDVASSTDVVIGSGDVVLSGGPGSYVGTGMLTATATDPGSIAYWNMGSFERTAGASSDVRVQVYSVATTGAYTLVPDGQLPGNSAGFNQSPINLSGLSTSTYDKLALGAILTSTDPTETPTLEAWELSYTLSEPSIASIPFTLQGDKTIGTTALPSPIYKYSATHTTDTNGRVTLTDLEWDVYTVTLDSGLYDIAEACNDNPFVLDPGVTDSLALTLVGNSAYSLRVRIIDTSGNPVPGAAVSLTRTGFSDSGETSLCGQTFFNSGLGDHTDYQVSVSADGYITEIVTDIVVDGDNTVTVTLDDV